MLDSKPENTRAGSFKQSTPILAITANAFAEYRGICLALGIDEYISRPVAPQDFDLPAVEAFSGGSVPVHLLTVEAMGIYLRHMRLDGVIAFHVTNRVLRIPPVVEAIALAHGDCTSRIFATRTTTRSCPARHSFVGHR